MVQAVGASAQIAYVEESTWGTTPGTPQMVLLKAATYGESLASTREELRSNSINASRSVENVKSGNVAVGGAVPIELPLEGIGTILKHAIGDTVVTTGTGPYTHTIKRGSLPTGLTIEKGFPDINQYTIHTGCRINGVSLSVATSGLVTGSLDVLGKDITASGTPLDATPTSPTHDPMVHHEANLVEEGGATATILGLEFNLTNEMDAEKYEVGSTFRASLPEGTGELTGSITFLFEDMTLFNKWLNGTESEFKIRFASGTSSLEFHFPRIKYTGEGAPKIDTPQGLVQVLNFRALYDATEASDIVVTLINGESTI